MCNWCKGNSTCCKRSSAAAGGRTVGTRKGSPDPQAAAPRTHRGDAMQPTDADPMEFIAQVPNARRKADAERMVDIMRAVTGEEPVMWGHGIVGFGSYHYVYASGREGDPPAAASSPRKANLGVYLIGGPQERSPEHLTPLGPHKAGNACRH